MNDQTDSQLLRAYAEHRSEAAFGELVRRHVDFVHSAAVRMVCDAHLAEDVTQGVFFALSKNAAQLAGRPVLAGWLHRTTQNLAAQLVRTEVRRRVREQEATSMNDLLAGEAEAVWEQISPQLDVALAELGETDRDALLLRYFQRKSAREIAQVLGTSEEAAQRRVTRAVERLREMFAKRGVKVAASGLAAVLSVNAVQAAPVGLSAAITTATVLGGTTLAGSTFTQAILMTTLQKTLVTAAIIAAVSTALYEVRQAAHYRDEAQTLRQQQEPLTEQVQRLQREQNQAQGRLAALRAENERLNRNNVDLMRLRGEVARLSGETRELAQLKGAAPVVGGDPALEATLRSWASRATLLRQRLDQMPDKKIPELQLLSEKEWLDAVKNSKGLETEEDFRKAFGNLRNIAKTEFAEQMRNALRRYATANDGQIPPDLAQLKSYFEGPVDDAMLQRYALLQSGKLNEVPNSEFLFAESAPPVDEDYDLFFQFKMQGTRSSRGKENPLQEAAVAFAKANNGQLPRDASQLTTYLRQPVEAAKVQEFLSRVPRGVTTLEQLKATGTMGK